MTRYVLSDLHGPVGPMGPVNPSSAPTDTAIGQWISTAGGSETQAAGDARWARTRIDPRDNGGSDVILWIGQSNAQGAGLGWDPAIDIAIPGINQYAGSGPNVGTVIPAIDPLFHVTSATSGGLPLVGPAMEFARRYWIGMASNRNVLIVPAAQAGTGFDPDPTYCWDYDYTGATTNLATRAIAQAQAAVALNPTNRLVAVVWQQGENDIDQTEDWYRTKMLRLFGKIRDAFPNVPILVGSMVPEWIVIDPTSRGPIDIAHRTVEDFLPRSAYVPGPAGYNQTADGQNNVHYTAAGARVMGRNLYDRFLAIDRPLTKGFTDSFNRGDAPQLGVTADGKAWSRAAQSLSTDVNPSIVNNAATGVGTIGYAISTVDARAANGTLTATLKAVGNGAGGLAFRAIGGLVASDFLYLRVLATSGVMKWALCERVAGALTVIVTGSTLTATAGDVAKVTMDGPFVSVTINGVAPFADQTVNEMRFNTRHGLYLETTAAGVIWDDISFTSV